MKAKISLVLVLCLVAALFAGCGSSSDSSEEKSNSVSEEAVIEESAEEEEPAEEPEAVPEEEPAEEPEELPAEEPEEEQPAEEPEEVPEEEQSVTMFPLNDMVTLTYMNTFDPNMLTYMEGQQDVATEAVIEELTNVHIEYMNLSPDVYSEQFNVTLLSDDLPDLIQEGVSYYPGGGAGAVEDGYFANINDYLEYMPNYSQEISEKDFVRRAVYCADDTIAAVFSVEEATNGNGVIIRQDWLDELGMDTPRTYDEIETVLLAMKSELNVEYPLILPSFLDYQYNMFSGGYDVPGSFDLIGMSQQLFVVDGEVRYAQYTEEYEEYVSMIARFYEEGLLDPDFIGYEMVRDYQDKINSGLVGLYLNNTSNLQDTTEATASMGAVWAGIQSPVQYEGQINHLTTYAESVAGLGSVSVSAKSDNVEAACAWLDYRKSDEITFLLDYGVEGETFNFDADGNIVWTDLILNNPDGLTTSQALLVYTNSGMGSTSRQMTLFTDYQLAAYEAWTTDVDGDYIYPSGIELDANSSSEASTLLGDIRTYISETSLQFVVGDKDLSEFADFRAELQNMGIERVIEIYQAAYDAYIAS